MKSTKNIFHTVTGVTFANDNSVLKFMITDENKQLCYLDVFSPVLNVLVDVPMTNHQLVHSDKASH